jgi:hypothetical protein
LVKNTKQRNILNIQNKEMLNLVNNTTNHCMIEMAFYITIPTSS